MKKNAIENKIDKGVNIEFSFKDIDEKIDYEAKKGRLSFKWLAPALTCCLVVLLGVVYFGISGSNKEGAVPMGSEYDSNGTATINIAEINFSYQGINYAFHNETTDMGNGTTAAYSLAAIDTSLVGDYVTNVTSNSKTYDIYRCNEDNLLLIKYDEGVYVKAEPTGFEETLTVKDVLEKGYGLEDSDYTTTTQNYINSINNFSSVDVTNFFLGLLESTIDDQGFDDLIEVVKQEAINRGVTTPDESYQGGYLSEHEFVLKTKDSEFKVYYYETRYIHTPHYIRFLDHYVKLSNKAWNAISTYYPINAD